MRATRAIPAADADAGDVVAFPRTPLMTVVDGPGGYAIETTEVTNLQFLKFRVIFGTDAGAPWAQCAAGHKTTLGPGACGGSTGYQQPVTCVDWCDANSYCTAIGRRLCGAIGGGTTNAAAIATDEWAHACGGPLGTLWPYGPSVVTANCQTADTKLMATVDVGTFPACQGGKAGGIAGIFDMTGNAAEWGAECVPDGGGCALHGGSWEVYATSARCDYVVGGGPTIEYPDVGFRCCADL